MIQPERIRRRNDKAPRNGQYVLYWMQQSQRAFFNHALEYAASQANDLQLPLVVVFGLTDRFPEANERHYAFMVEGLRETQRALAKRGAQLVVRRTIPDRAALELAADAALLVTDRGYLRIQREWRIRVAKSVACPMVEVESDSVIPVETASNREEYAARTIRPKLMRMLPRFLVPLTPRRLKRDSMGLKFDSVVLDDVDGLLAQLRLDRTVARVASTTGGASQAERLLETFLNGTLAAYGASANDPAHDGQSGLGPYLHFGQISPLYVALEVSARAQGRHSESVAVFLEQLIIRRELALNLTHFNPRYDQYDVLPEWARRTLDKHARDRRDPTYTAAQLESARTHDPYWNAAMAEMAGTGKMHGYMRMYWGKKIIEWTRDPREAFRIALALNNKYFLDGRDPNGFTNVAWLFGKHDRPWQERPIFGTVRYMNAKGLERKFDMDDYVDRVKRSFQMVEERGGATRAQ
ncbi:MAG: deoxyribodipyrimidine photo-lyase [Candidatus Hydrogenedentes bacterium]|nr:deoxyribodipyrimidine photo-lyase [Candidatus Hydrogenedentota bacterium]